MTTLSHPVAPEDVMALIDGELTAGEAAAVSHHIENCAECSALRDRMRSTSQSLSDWAVPPAPETLDATFQTQLAAAARNSKLLRMGSGFNLRNWRIWAVAGGSAVCGALALVVFTTSISYYGEHAAAKPQQLMAYMEPDSASAGFAMASRAAPKTRTVEPVAPNDKQWFSQAGAKVGIIGGAGGAPQPQTPAGAPMIARTASLTILVKDLDSARSGMDAILIRHHGYSAELTISDEAPSRGLQGSLRIPASDMDAAVAELRAIGRVQREKQAGEEVTEQHTDLVARLANARETEARLRDILANRTGKIQDVLDVEEQISNTRGEIEQLEAEQENLEHRVEFASVDVELVEQYEAKLGGPSTSISNQMRNSFIAGLRHAGSSLFGVVLFFEEYGPVLLLWLILLGVPGMLIWRRYRRG